MRLGGSYGDRDRGMLDLKSVDMRFMYLMELSGKDIYVGDKKCKRVKIYVGRPLRDTPKTYKRR